MPIVLDGTANTVTPLTASGVATFTAGSAAAPAITTTGDTNTGMFFPAADTIAFSEGGTEVMRIDASGNLSGTNIAATFTPTLVGNGPDEISYNGTGQVLTGAYTRISKVVTLSIKYTQTNAIQAGTPYQSLRIYVPANITPSGATIISCVGNLQTGTYPNQVNYSFNSAGTGGGAYMNAEHWGTGSLAGQTNPVFTFTIVYLLA